METTRRIDLDLAVQAAERYVKVGFELAEGAESVEVVLKGSRGVEGLTVDLGCESPTGWRGWSGGARDWFVIGATDATPGYLPGLLEAGTWNVMLGVHTVPAGGAAVEVSVISPARRSPDHGPQPEPAVRQVRGRERGLPAPDGLTWFAGDMHAHSLHSDGSLSLAELANEAVRSGLDFLCVTDHNTVSHHEHLVEVGARHGITLLPGQEVTTHRGHANAYGRIGFVDFRRPVREWAEAVSVRDGILSINHPVSGDCSWLHPVPDGPVGVELYHGSWYQEPISTAALAWFDAAGVDAVVIGGGDFHNYDTPLRPGMPTTWIAAEDDSEDALLEGLRLGRTTVTAGVTLADGVGRPDLMGTPALVPDERGLTAHSAVGLVLVSGSGRRRVIEQSPQRLDVPAGDAPYRLEDAARRVWALTGRWR